MSFSLQHKEIHISSDNRGSGTDSDFVVYLQNPLHNVKKIRLTSCEFAWTRYVFNSSNNKVYLTESVGSTDIVATITPGNYTSSELETELKTQLDAASVTGGNSHTYTVSISLNTFKMSITVNTGTVLLTASGSNSCHETLGFSTTTSTASTITGDEVIRLSGLNYVLLHSNLALIRKHASYYNNESTNHDVLQRIPITVNTGEVVYYNAIDQPYSDTHGSDILEIRIRLTDGNSNTIQLNGSPISLKLDVWTEEYRRLE